MKAFVWFLAIALTMSGCHFAQERKALEYAVIEKSLGEIAACSIECRDQRISFSGYFIVTRHGSMISDGPEFEEAVSAFLSQRHEFAAGVQKVSDEILSERYALVMVFSGTFQGYWTRQDPDAKPRFEIVDADDLFLVEGRKPR